ncbi:MAG: inositol monophosphatase [Phycisphaerae bacterium]|nr:inositol monophosphatase [Phycisphaerae bacterium]MDW8261948.1 inositol monophosphatase [Phycisphaerales bacterium]
MSLRDDLEFVSSLARSAGAIAREHYGKVDRLTKTHAAADDEAVTLADRAVQAHVVAGLRWRFPADGIIGEEDDAGRGITFDCRDPLGRNWVIDPIDGTNNFISGLGHFAVCIGLLEAASPVLGVVYDVTHDELYAAATGCGATLNGRAIRALQTPLSPASMLMMTSNLIGPTGRVPGWAVRWISQTVWKLRILGSAALESVLVARGVAHAAVTVNGKLWDCVAPAAIVLEAGGVVSDLAGKPIFPFELRNYTGAKVPYISAGPAAHEQIVSEIAAYP